MLYILLARLTDDGQQRMIQNPDTFSSVTSEVHVPGTQLLARYAVLGQYDFVIMVEASEPESVARLSIELGGRCGLHVETLLALSAHTLAEPWDPQWKLETTRVGEPGTGPEEEPERPSGAAP